MLLLESPALKSVSISGCVACLSHLRILVSCWRPHSFKIFFSLHHCQKFDFLPHIWYSWYTHEMVLQENPNCIAASEMLCPISHLSTITPHSKPLKSWYPAIVAAETGLTASTGTCCLILVLLTASCYTDWLHTSVICICMPIPVFLALQCTKLIAKYIHISSNYYVWCFYLLSCINIISNIL